MVRDTSAEVRAAICAATEPERSPTAKLDANPELLNYAARARARWQEVCK